MRDDEDRDGMLQLSMPDFAEQTAIQSPLHASFPPRAAPSQELHFAPDRVELFFFWRSLIDGPTQGGALCQFYDRSAQSGTDGRYRLYGGK